MKPDWTIREAHANWECDWEGSRRFHLRYFKALSLTEKVQAVERMGKTASYFAQKAAARRLKNADKNGHNLAPRFAGDHIEHK